MMPLTEIDRLKRTVTSAWESPVADRVAAAWGYPTGTAKWWRSSASHVFVLPDPGGKRYLRFVPDAYRGADAVERVSVLMERLAADGAAVVGPVRSGTGSLTATVSTELGTMHAMVVEAAAGDEVDAEDLTDDLAREWGRALARVHDGAAGIDVGLPAAFAELAEIPDLFAEDPALVRAAARLADELARLPRDRSRFGAVHGDFELDNLAWHAGRATAFDLDEAALSWYAADVPTGHRTWRTGSSSKSSSPGTAMCGRSMTPTWQTCSCSRAPTRPARPSASPVPSSRPELTSPSGERSSGPT
jgi:Ser/Thr protein kinase RdoA (MazF antagonist)